MANDHFAICETNKKYCYLGEFYEGDVNSQDAIDKRMQTECHSDRLNNGVGVMYMLRLCAFMQRHHSFGVRVINENEFWDIQDLDKNIKWIEDEL